MSATQIAVLVVVLGLLVVGVSALLAMQRRRRLREQFGTEYEHAARDEGGRLAADKELADRAKRHEQLDIRPLDEASRTAFSQRWRETQELFVDSPKLAIAQADRLIQEVMVQRGYPVGDFGQQAKDLSVEHADVVEPYRTAHEISDRSDRGEASTEDLRTAMIHYRTLFARLLGVVDLTVAQQRSEVDH